MAEHMRRHNGEKPYSCSECGKVGIKQQFKQFILLKTFLFDYLIQTFAGTSDLHAHRLHVHHIGDLSKLIKEKVECPVCKKVLSCKGRFNRHMKTHTGARPYKCTECDKVRLYFVHWTVIRWLNFYFVNWIQSFTVKSYLKNHVKAIHVVGENKFTCDKCGKV